MTGRFITILAAILALFFLNLSCSSSIFHAKQQITDNRYGSEFPSQNYSDELQKISETIYRVSAIAFYKTYTFDPKSKIKKDELTDELINSNFIKTTVLDKPALGTGTLIYSSGGLLGILTCAHVVDFPDTIITYFAEPSGIFSDYVQSVSFKTKQDVYIAGFPEGSEVDVILKNDDLDIAFLGRQYNVSLTTKYPVFDYSMGKAKDLEWGSFVYLMGYPLNYKMISRAIVSNPDYDKEGSFLIDAPINKGFSGGIVLASRGGSSNFELVGIIQSVPEQTESILEPTLLDNKFQYSTLIPYKGNIYVQQLKMLNYGIAKVIPVEKIIGYLKKNKEKLINKGYYLSIF